MSTRTLTYLQCDECGNPSDLGDNVKEARRVAIASGWVAPPPYKGGDDLCPRCADAVLRITCETCGEALTSDERLLGACSSCDDGGAGA